MTCFVAIYLWIHFENVHVSSDEIQPSTLSALTFHCEFYWSQWQTCYARTINKLLCGMFVCGVVVVSLSLYCHWNFESLSIHSRNSMPLDWDVTNLKIYIYTYHLLRWIEMGSMHMLKFNAMSNRHVYLKPLFIRCNLLHHTSALEHQISAQ